MDFYRPTYAEYIWLRESFLTLVDDYLLVYKLRGVTRLSDLYVMEHNPSYLGEIREGAIRMTNSLLALVTHVDELAEQGAHALGQEWPERYDLEEFINLFKQVLTTLKWPRSYSQIISQVVTTTEICSGATCTDSPKPGIQSQTFALWWIISTIRRVYTP